MATYSGKHGSVELDAQNLMQMKTWSIETTAEPVESSVIGDDWRRYKGSMKGYTVTIEGLYDIEDGGQGVIDIDQETAFKLHPAGEVSTEREWSGTMLITAYSETASFDGMVEFSLTGQGTGALNKGAVT